VSHRDGSVWSFKHFVEQFVVGVEARRGRRLGAILFRVASGLQLLGDAAAGTHRDAVAGTR
jgi:hypothetical protein